TESSRGCRRRRWGARSSRKNFGHEHRPFLVAQPAVERSSEVVPPPDVEVEARQPRAANLLREELHRLPSVSAAAKGLGDEHVVEEGTRPRPGCRSFGPEDVADRLTGGALDDVHVM